MKFKCNNMMYKIKKWMNKVLKTQFNLYKLVPKKLKIWE